MRLESFFRVFLHEQIYRIINRLLSMDIQFPPFLQKDDKVVIVSPSSKIDKLFLKGAKKRLESWGLKVAMGKHAGGSSGRFAEQSNNAWMICRMQWTIRK